MRKINVLDRITFAGLLMTVSLVCGAAGPAVAAEADASAIKASLAGRSPIEFFHSCRANPAP